MSRLCILIKQLLMPGAQTSPNIVTYDSTPFTAQQSVTGALRMFSNPNANTMSSRRDRTTKTAGRKWPWQTATSYILCHCDLMVRHTISRVQPFILRSFPPSSRPPRVTKRRRSLTGLMEASNGARSKKPGTADVQETSWLFRLSGELRTTIYKNVIGTQAVHVILRGGGLVSYRCRCDRRRGGERVDSVDSCWIWCHNTCVEENIMQPFGIGVMGVVQSCRRV